MLTRKEILQNLVIVPLEMYMLNDFDFFPKMLIY